MTPTVIAMLSRDGSRRDLNRMVARGARLLYCSGPRELLHLTAVARPTAIVMEVRDLAGRVTAGTARALRSMHPGTPVLVWCSLTADDVQLLLSFADAGVTDILLAGTAGDALTRCYVEPAVAEGLEAVRTALKRACPASLHPLVDYCLTRASEPLRVADLATVFGISSRALTKRMETLGLPAPAVFLTCCRLALAARRLATSNAPFEQVADSVGFASGNSLRNALRRYTGMSPRDVRSHADLHRLVDHLLRSEMQPVVRRLEA